MPAAKITTSIRPKTLSASVIRAAQSSSLVKSVGRNSAGQPAAEKVYGKPVFQYFAEHPDVSEVFNDGMTSFSALVIPAVLEVYDFNGIGTLVDVAGGHGQVLTSILRKYPEMHGILFDIEHVVAGARPKIEGMGLAGRCRTEPCRPPEAGTGFSSR